jgi:hypothetical protein
MPLTKQEIIDYASRYTTPDEHADFPVSGDLFCLLDREIPADKVLAEEEGWRFSGYGVCLGYALDEEAKPAGKWLWMHFASLSAFPPTAQVFKLQPPHVVKGRFFDPTRTREFRIVKVNLAGTGRNADAEKTVAPKTGRVTGPTTDDATRGKIIKFRRKKTT